MKLIHGQILTFCARILFQHAKIVSGAYKQEKKWRRVNDEQAVTLQSQGFPMKFEDGYHWYFVPETELLREHVAIMERHIDHLQKCIEHLPVDAE